MPNPEFLTLLESAIPENFPGLVFKESWGVALRAFWDAEIEKGTDPELFMDVATALGGYPKRYINYSMTFQNWLRREKRRADERAPSPILNTNQRNITPISEEARKQWNERYPAKRGSY